MFREPIPIDVERTVDRAPPKSWNLDAKTLAFLPLVDAKNPIGGMPGWCVYTDGFLETPEVEVICGGRNSKQPSAAAIWRQGNLTHFGFEPDPSQYNDIGRALLVNTIVYASRFADDRPMFRVTSPFKSNGRKRRAITPDFVAKWRSSFKLNFVDFWFEEPLLRTVPRTDAATFWAWFDENRPFLRTGAGGKLEMDADARALGARPRTPTFLADSIAALARGGEDAKRARTLLTRYAPLDRPPADADAAAWRTWSDANGPYLFWSESQGNRWCVDPVAKKRGIPTAECRGPKRAGPYPFER